MSGALVFGLGYLAMILAAGLPARRKYAGRHRSIAQAVTDTLTGLSARDAEWLRFLIAQNEDPELAPEVKHARDLRSNSHHYLTLAKETPQP